jgi:hypothetical protein
MSDIKKFIPPQEASAAIPEIQEYTMDQAVERGIQELQTILTDPNFIAEYVEVMSEVPRQALDTAKQAYAMHIKKQIKEYIAKAAAANLSTTVEEGRTRGKDWGQAMAQVTEITVDGTTYPVVKQSCVALETVMLAQPDEEYTPAIVAAERALQEIEMVHTQALQQIAEEVVSRETDVNFRDALSIWGRSPNAAGEWGTDNTGFHAGVIHYFEYRRDKGKAGRYKREETPFGVDGFIAYSEPFTKLLSSSDLAQEPQVQAYTTIHDELGQERLILFTNPTDPTKEGDLIVAFQRASEPMFVISAISANRKSYDKYVQDELNPPPGKKKLNNLGAERTIVTQYTK